MVGLPTGPRIPNNPTLEVITTSLASCALSKTNKINHMKAVNMVLGPLGTILVSWSVF